VSRGLGFLNQDDHALLASGMAVYDALYAWCRGGGPDGHSLW